MEPRPDWPSFAAAQTVPIRGNVEANLEQHLALVQLARSAGTQLLVFPELSLTGYEIDLADDLAFVPDDPRLAPLRDAAAQSAMTLVVGAPARLTPESQRGAPASGLHIGALIIAPDGTTDIYTKQHLGAFCETASVDGVVPPAESVAFVPGDNNPLVSVAECNAAVAVCADTGHLGHAEMAAQRGANLYLASMFIIPSQFAPETARLRRHGAQCGMAIALANFGGPSGGLEAAGQSAVWSSHGECLAQLGPRRAGVVVAIDGRVGWSASLT